MAGVLASGRVCTLRKDLQRFAKVTVLAAANVLVNLMFLKKIVYFP
ncbi:hypothetical protein [Cedecea davisae]|nr:hypothetical protein [Cedecea davisae]